MLAAVWRLAQLEQRCLQSHYSLRRFDSRCIQQRRTHSCFPVCAMQLTQFPVAASQVNENPLRLHAKNSTHHNTSVKFKEWRRKMKKGVTHQHTLERHFQRFWTKWSTRLAVRSLCVSCTTLTLTIGVTACGKPLQLHSQGRSELPDCKKWSVSQSVSQSWGGFMV